MSDAHIIIGAAWCLAGYIAGALAMVSLFWRRLRMRCPSCGKDLAVVKATGKVWVHRCVAPRPGHIDPILDPRD